MKPSVQIKTGTSKKGNTYKYILVKIADYEGRLFPTKGEVAYIELLAQQAKAEEGKVVTADEG